MKKHTIIGTAGHIDHGKTAVIKALTGIDADRLKEEKERGITIDIGFAYWRDDITILDVPGHEKFIRNMVAGVSTIDFFLLVIAADDGIMPQTIEHLDILNFFNVRDGIVVINKKDLVDEEWLELVKEEVLQLLEKYNLQSSPIVSVSASTKENIDQLREIVDQKMQEQTESESSQPFRHFVDRSFIIKGFGTVVTGTVLSGDLSKGEEVEVLPAGLIKNVRGLQAHGKETESVNAGDRAAINLQGISKTEISRGDVLVKPGALTTITEFSGLLKTVSKIPIKIGNRSEVRVYTGTAENIGRLIWYEKDRYLNEQSTYHVKVVLDTPIAAARNDAFLIRLNSPIITLAGGRVLEITPPKIHHKETEWKTYFKIMTGGDEVDILTAILKQLYLTPVPLEFLSQKLFQNIYTVKKTVENLVKQKKVRILQIKGLSHYILEENFDLLVIALKNQISEFHQQNAHLPGINTQTLLSQSHHSWISLEVLESALRKLINSNSIKLENQYYSLKDFKIEVSKNVDEVKTNIEKKFLEARYSPPSLTDISHDLDMSAAEIRSVANILIQEQRLVHINQDFYLHHSCLTDLKNYLVSYFQKNEEMPVADLKSFIATTRKYAIPLFEYLDAEGFTRRRGDVRLAGHKLGDG